MNKIMPRYIIQKSKLNQSNFFEDLLNNLFIMDFSLLSECET